MLNGTRVRTGAGVHAIDDRKRKWAESHLPHAGLAYRIAGVGCDRGTYNGHAMVLRADPSRLTTA